MFVFGIESSKFQIIMKVLGLYFFIIQCHFLGPDGLNLISSRDTNLLTLTDVKLGVTFDETVGAVLTTYY